MRRGMTLIELLLATTIVAMVFGTLAALASGVRQAYEHTEAYGLTTQHARVVLERIHRTAVEAVASDEFPGFIVVPREQSGHSFPEMLIVWSPRTFLGDPKPAQNPEGLPRYNEVVIFCPHPTIPSRLVEMTFPFVSNEVPPPDEMGRWQAELEALIKGNYWATATLTDLLRTAAVTDNVTSTTRRLGAVRFSTRLRPSEAEWEDFLAGDLAWKELSWVQGVYGADMGLRQNWVRIEVQLVAGVDEVATGDGAYQPVTFYDSAALYYELHRP